MATPCGSFTRQRSIEGPERPAARQSKDWSSPTGCPCSASVAEASSSLVLLASPCRLLVRAGIVAFRGFGRGRGVIATRNDRGEPCSVPDHIDRETNPRFAAWRPVAAGAKSTEYATAKRRKRSAAGRTSGSRCALRYRGSRGTSNSRRRGDFGCLLSRAHGERRSLPIFMETKEVWRVWAGRKMT